MTSIAKRMTWGLIGGVVATAVMSAQMVAPGSVTRIGTPPPQRIADALLPHSSEKERRRAAAVLHLAIGGGSGMLYRALVRRRRGGILSGVAFGLLVWIIGYEVVVPALGVLPRGDHDLPARRTAMIEAHLLYGATLGFFS